MLTHALHEYSQSPGITGLLVQWGGNHWLKSIFQHKVWAIHPWCQEDDYIKLMGCWAHLWPEILYKLHQPYRRLTQQHCLSLFPDRVSGFVLNKGNAISWLGWYLHFNNITVSYSFLLSCDKTVASEKYSFPQKEFVPPKVGCKHFSTSVDLLFHFL